MTQSFEEFLKENKQLHYEEGMIDGDCISVKKLGEWALEQAKYWKQYKEKNQDAFYYYWNMRGIAEACFGKKK